MPAGVLTIGPIRAVMANEEVRFFVDAPKERGVVHTGCSLEEITGTLKRHSREISHKRLVLDLQDVDYLNSLQLGLLVAIKKACEPWGRVALDRVSDRVDELLRTTALAPMFDRVH